LENSQLLSSKEKTLSISDATKGLLKKYVFQWQLNVVGCTGSSTVCKTDKVMKVKTQ